MKRLINWFRKDNVIAGQAAHIRQLKFIIEMQTIEINRLRAEKSPSADDKLINTITELGYVNVTMPREVGMQFFLNPNWNK